MRGPPILEELGIIKRAQMTERAGDSRRRRRRLHIHTHATAFDANTLSHDISTPPPNSSGAPRLRPHGWAVGMQSWAGLCKLTRRSGACRPGRTEPPEPSISRADDPATTETQENGFSQQNRPVRAGRRPPKTWTGLIPSCPGTSLSQRDGCVMAASVLQTPA